MIVVGRSMFCELHDSAPIAALTITNRDDLECHALARAWRSCFEDPDTFLDTKSTHRRLQKNARLVTMLKCVVATMVSECSREMLVHESEALQLLGKYPSLRSSNLEWVGGAMRIGLTPVEMSIAGPSVLDPQRRDLFLCASHDQWLSIIETPRHLLHDICVNPSMLVERGYEALPGKFNETTSLDEVKSRMLQAAIQRNSFRQVTRNPGVHLVLENVPSTSITLEETGCELCIDSNNGLACATHPGCEIAKYILEQIVNSERNTAVRVMDSEGDVARCEEMLLKRLMAIIPWLADRDKSGLTRSEIESEWLSNACYWGKMDRFQSFSDRPLGIWGVFECVKRNIPWDVYSYWAERGAVEIADIPELQRMHKLRSDLSPAQLLYMQERWRLQLKDDRIAPLGRSDETVSLILDCLARGIAPRTIDEHLMSKNGVKKLRELKSIDGIRRRLDASRYEPIPSYLYGVWRDNLASFAASPDWWQLTDDSHVKTVDENRSNVSWVLENDLDDGSIIE